MQNVLQILEASDKMNVPDIKKYALGMIVREYSQVARLPKINDLSRELLLEIIEAMADVLAEIRITHDLTPFSVHSDIWNLLFSKYAVNILYAWLQKHRVNDEDEVGGTGADENSDWTLCIKEYAGSWDVTLFTIFSHGFLYFCILCVHILMWFRTVARAELLRCIW